MLLATVAGIRRCTLACKGHSRLNGVRGADFEGGARGTRIQRHTDAQNVTIE
jgi:hypothetical protein